VLLVVGLVTLGADRLFSVVYGLRLKKYLSIGNVA
jgi:hypothetical protein